MINDTLTSSEIKKTLPNINVTIPVFNRSDLIGRAIENTLRLENVGSVTVVNDGSDAATHEAILKFKGAEKLNYLRLETNIGADAARNLSLLLSDYEWISFHDSDDLYDRRKLAKQFTRAEQTGSDIAFCKFVHLDLEYNLSVRGNKIRLLQDLHTNVVFENNFADYILINPGLFSRRVFERLGGFKPGKFGGDDDLQYRVVLGGCRICFIDEPLILKNDQTDSITTAPETHLKSAARLRFYEDLRRNIKEMQRAERAPIIPIDLPEYTKYEIIFAARGENLNINTLIPMTEGTERILTENIN